MLTKEIHLKGKRVVLTGGKGFLGSHLAKLLVKEDPSELVIPTSSDCDLRQVSKVRKLVKGADIVIHLAAKVGGIGFNRQYPATMFYDNALMGIHVLHESYKAGVEKIVNIGTICAYPKFTPVPFKEENLWNGYPEETNAPYGLAKKMLLVQSQAYATQYGLNSIYLLPTNLYGPGDKFNLDTSHVIPALIKKFLIALAKGQPTVVVWGTGKPTREFLYVEDAARAILLATKKYNGVEPVNLGSNNEISIASLAQLIKKLVGYQGKIIFDHSKPDGQPRRKINTSRAKQQFGFVSTVDFEEGLKRTIDWYHKQISK